MTATKPRKPLDPATYAASGSEHAEQTALFIWASQNARQWPALRLLFAIPNGGQRDKITAARLKAEGVKSGVPDVMLPVARHGMHGLFIEMKRGKSDGKAKGIVSNKQATWKEDLQAQGYGVAYSYSWQEAKAVLEEYLK